MWIELYPNQPSLGLPVSIDSGDAESLRNRLFSLFIFVEFLGHFYEFLSSNFSSICQESSPSKDTLLSMCRVKLVHEQITEKVFANPTVLDSACCASMQFAFAPERTPILVATSRTTWFLLSVQEGTGSAICTTRCDKFLVHSYRLGYQQIGSIIIGSGWLDKTLPHTHTHLTTDDWILESGLAGELHAPSFQSELRELIFPIKDFFLTPLR